MEGSPLDMPSAPKQPSKIDEYVERVRAGETIESFGAIPESWKAQIAERADSEAPGREHRIEELKKEILETMGAPAEHQALHGWTASYELARIARIQGVDLSRMSREEYADFAVQHSLAIDDDQLRVAPWQRMATSVQDIVMENRERKARITEESEKGFAQFSFGMQQKAATEDRAIAEGIRVRQGTKDSNSWLYFGINKGTGEKQAETYKSYVSVKDLNTLTSERFKNLMTALRDAGYNGDIKIFQDLSEQGVRLNDQIVMHGASEADAKLALVVAEEFFGDDLDQKSVGKDQVVDGESKSYSQLLADKIARTVRK